MGYRCDSPTWFPSTNIWRVWRSCAFRWLVCARTRQLRIFTSGCESVFIPTRSWIDLTLRQPRRQLLRLTRKRVARYHARKSETTRRVKRMGITSPHDTTICVTADGHASLSKGNQWHQTTSTTITVSLTNISHVHAVSSAWLQLYHNALNTAFAYGLLALT